MEPSKLRSEVLEIANDAGNEPFTARSMQSRLGPGDGEPDLEVVQDVCVSLVIEGELDVLTDGSDRRFNAGSET